MDVPQLPTHIPALPADVPALPQPTLPALPLPSGVIPLPVWSDELPPLTTPSSVKIPKDAPLRARPGYYLTYVLRLEKGKYYCGHTQRELCTRVGEHKAGRGAEWTRLYPVLEVVFVQEDTKFLEDKVTLDYMERYGVENVRGGSYAEPELSKTQLVELSRKIKAADFGLPKVQRLKSGMQTTLRSALKVKRLLPKA